MAEETVLKQLEAIALPPSQPVPPSVGVLSSEAWSLEEAASFGFGDIALSSWRAAPGRQAVLGHPRHHRRLHPHRKKGRRKVKVHLPAENRAKYLEPSSFPFWGAATGGRSTE